MISFIYKKWDGTQRPFDMNRKDIMDEFMENIMKGMTPDMALGQMMWHGFPGGIQFRLMSLEQMVNELKQQLMDLFSKYSLEGIFDDPVNDLKNLLNEEAETRKKKGLSPSPSFDDLSPGLLEKLRDLESFKYENEDSRDTLDSWLERKKDIFDLYEFYGDYHEFFTGSEYMNFEQAVELMRRFQSIQNLQMQIMSGRLDKIDLKQLREMLGENAENSFIFMMQIPEMLSEEGIIEFNRRFEMTAKGMRTLGEKAFGKSMTQIKKDRAGRQPGNAPQAGEIEPDTSRPYQFGDRFDPDITRSILNAVARQDERGLRLSHEDFYIRERERLVRSTTCLLLDLSWSMSFGDRFGSAKKVMLSLEHFVRTRFPKDKMHVIGFSTEARELKGKELASVMWDGNNPFTNLQGALQLAMKLIKKSGNRNNRVIVITDGQPTAYYEGGQLHVELPQDFFGLSRSACRATLKEVRKVTAAGMNIEIFMLDDNPVLVEFTNQMCKINRGRSVMCLPDELGRLVLSGEINRRRWK